MCYHHLLVLSVLAAILRPLGDPAAHHAPHWYDMHVKHAWNAVPETWESMGPPLAGATIDLSIALKPHDENALIDALHEVSNPRHPKYGAHLSKEQVAGLVAPHPDTLELVNSWLERYSVPSSSISTSHGGNWLTLTHMPVSKANDLLGASYEHFLHAETNETILRTVSYALPAILHAHVQTIVPTTFFGSPQNPRVRRTSDAAAQAQADSGEPVKMLSSRVNYVAPSYLRWLYNTLAYVPSAVGKNVFGTVGFLGQFATQDDLTKFMNLYRPDGANAAYTAVQVCSAEYNSNEPSIEGNLNVQYAVAMAYPTAQVYYSICRRGDPFVSWLGYILKQTNIPQTISTTYGIAEQFVPQEYAEGVCFLYAQLGARGISVLYASGNSGVGRGDCAVEDSSGNVHVEFLPTFPASCPWITAVGGTTGHLPEVAASLSGGGFSKYFPRPPYQENAVFAYLQNLGNRYHDQGLYRAGGRGLPDIAAQALGYVTINSGKVVYRQGTSCSTPTAAGIISLLNDHQLSNGKPPLGFLNPWLYSGGLAGLNDIKSGSNLGCNTDGFSAAAGWDPVTGLGTPDFEKLLQNIPTLPNAPSSDGGISQGPTSSVGL